MKVPKTLIILFSLIVGVFLLYAVNVLAGDVPVKNPDAYFDNLTVGYGLQETGDSGGFDISGTRSLAEVAGTVVLTALSLLGVIFTSLVIYGGYLWMTAQGKQDQVGKAKEILISAIIGLFITLGAYIITTLVFQAINGQS